MQSGIDVSKWQGDIDWGKVREAGIDFAMIRASLGSYTKDPYFDSNVKGAGGAGLHTGAYHYFYSRTVEEALAEAQFFLSVLGPHRLDYPVVLDVEVQPLTDSGDLTGAVVSFCDTVEKTGYYTMIYSSKDWLDHILDYDRIKRFDIWLAQWAEAPTWDKPFGMWQHSSMGLLGGIKGNVDLDVSYRDYDTVIAASGLYGAAAPVSAPTPVSGEQVYTVVRGDTLSGIAAKFGTSFQVLARYNGIINPNLIVPGQKIKIPAEAGAPPSPKTYTVVPGDTLSSIAYRFGTTYRKLAVLNGITDPNRIFPGQVLKIE